MTALHERELDKLGAFLWSSGARARGVDVPLWEETWWSERLPHNRDARVLVGGCGAGREVLWLLDRGYRVDAFEPASSLVHIARERVRARGDGHRARIEQLDYASWLRRDDNHTSYDAVVLGWGSFSHVLSAASRAALLRACREVCPAGPILVSWMRRASSDSHYAVSRNNFASRVGGFLGALRGVQRDVDGDVMMRIGVTHEFAEGEVESLARAAGLRFQSEAGEYPHATLYASKATRRMRDDVGDALLADVLAQRSGMVVARGQSMSPAIPSGARVRLEKPTRITHGDVVAVRIQGSLFIHRVVGVDARGALLLKGDALSAPDGWVEAHDVIGRVVSIDARDGRGERPAPPKQRVIPRWRRAIARVERGAAALRGRDAR